ncbi:MAG: hypothetical protein AAB336_04450 [Acidobacteriota bacterium]
MKNLDRLLIIFAIFIGLACRCNSDLFGSKRTPDYSTPNTTPNTVTTPNLADLGEYRQCSERQSLKFGNTGGSAPLTVNNGSQFAVKIFRLGANNYQSQYNNLSPGDTVTQRSSSRGEWWMITDAKGNCQMIVAPPNVVNIK